LYDAAVKVIRMAVSNVAKRLAQLRERAGYSVREFAKEIGYSGSRYHYYEREYKKAYLPTEFVEKIAPRLVGKGIPPISITEIVSLYGSEPMTESSVTRKRELPEVEDAIDAPTGPQIRSMMLKDVPVLGTATGGSDADFTIMNGDAVDWVRRPPRLAGRKDVFALWVRSDSMARWRSPGDLVYCEVARHPQNGDHVVIEMKPDGIDDFRQAYLKKLVSQGGNDYTVCQYNPEREFKIPKDKVQAVYRVIDWAELMSV
jgi:phage repressor protein C with HTH and peptisase S24 domain/DNA-binding XRE family transcriptional regulator